MPNDRPVEDPKSVAQHINSLEDETNPQFVTELYDMVWRANELPGPRDATVYPSVEDIYNELKAIDPRDQSGEVILKTDTDGNAYLYVPPLTLTAPEPGAEETATESGESVEALLFRPSRWNEGDEEKLNEYLDKFATEGVDKEALKEALQAVMTGNMDVLATVIDDWNYSIDYETLGAFYGALEAEGFTVFAESEACRGLGPNFSNMSIIAPGEKEGVQVSVDFNTDPDEYQATTYSVKGVTLTDGDKDGYPVPLAVTYPSRWELAQRVQQISRLARQ